MANRLDAMAIRIEQKRRVIGRVIMSWSGLAVVAPAGGKRRGVERIDGPAIPGTETQMAAARRNDGARLLGNRKLNAGRTRCGTIIGTLPAAKIDDPYQPERSQGCIVERAAARDVADSERNMNQHGNSRLLALHALRTRPRQRYGADLVSAKNYRAARRRNPPPNGFRHTGPLRAKADVAS